MIKRFFLLWTVILCLVLSACGKTQNSSPSSDTASVVEQPLLPEIQESAETQVQNDSAPSTQTDDNNGHKSNLDWIPNDNDPDDNRHIYYKIELDGETKNYHYLLIFDLDDDIVNGSRTHYENEWRQLEGGRIWSVRISDTPIEWGDSEHKNGTFSDRSQVFSFEILNDTLVIDALDEDTLNLSGNYSLALPK